VELNFSHNNIESLTFLQNLTNLVIVNCTDNMLINLNGLENLTNLRELYCCNNKLIKLEELKNLDNLTILSCNNTKLSSLFEISNLININKLSISGNFIKSLNDISNLTKIKNLYCDSNKLISLDGIENMLNLKNLNCANNMIISLKQIKRLTLIENLNCISNKLVYINDIIYLNNLKSFYYSGNEIGIIPQHIVRKINMLKNNQKIYDDNQNVHNHVIQECVKNSIYNIIQIEPSNNIKNNIIQIIIDDDILTNETKNLLIEYSTDKDIHTLLNLTFGELLIYVFDRIEQNEHKNEIKKILNIEIHDSICKCFTGRISRLVNCLNGFDKLVNINISDSEQISYIITSVMNELLKNNNYSVESHKTLVKNQLNDLKYDVNVIDLWVNEIE
jgi:Leucine-rich repeat (LRR) protein